MFSNILQRFKQPQAIFLTGSVLLKRLQKRCHSQEIFLDQTGTDTHGCANSFLLTNHCTRRDSGSGVPIAEYFPDTFLSHLPPLIPSVRPDYKYPHYIARVLGGRGEGQGLWSCWNSLCRSGWPETHWDWHDYRHASLHLAISRAVELKKICSSNCLYKLPLAITSGSKISTARHSCALQKQYQTDIQRRCTQFKKNYKAQFVGNSKILTSPIWLYSLGKNILRSRTGWGQKRWRRPEWSRGKIRASWAQPECCQLQGPGVHTQAPQTFKSLIWARENVLITEK